MIGRIRINASGKQSITKKGKRDLTGKDVLSEGTCCCCKPYTLATFVTNGGTWDLTPYQGGIAKPNRYWRLTNNYTSYVPIQRGCVDENGKLVGLPDSTSTTTYKYTWTFRIEIGCSDEENNLIRYPTGTESVNLYNCNKDE
jgi:hypothetical protein